MNKFGKGIFKYNPKNGGTYTGTVPMIMANGKEHEVYIIDRQDFDLILRGGLEMLFETRADMGEEMFKTMPDCWVITDEQKEEHRLYLDRHVYFSDYKNSIWIRYESVDQAEKEGDFEPPRSNGNLGDEYGC